MNKLLTITIPFLLLVQTIFSQSKEIKGDTAYWYKRNIEFQKNLDLIDF